MTALLIVAPTWDATPWVLAMKAALPQLEIRTWPDLGHKEDIAYAACWLPPPNVLRGLPGLKVIFSLGAGVDAILSDKTLPPGIPIVRVNDADLTNRMSEYVVLQVLMHHRQQRRLDENQRNKRWEKFTTYPAKDMRVGIMGLGVLGQDAARKLLHLGFVLNGWSRSAKQIEGVTSFAGIEQRDAFLAATDILVCLLPATSETEGIINRSLLGKLSRNGPFGAPILINAGRGQQQNESDILACLNDGTIYAASLDVFTQEPLPVESALWSHPRVMITPHMAADSEPSSICAYVARQIGRFKQGQNLQNVVDPERGY